MKTSDLFIKLLEEKGVETIYGVPGEENLDFINSLRTSKKIQLILTRNEQTAVFMAATYGRLTGKLGVALATLGPGATNMLTGVAYAQLGGFPILLITGQKPIKKSKQGQFQIVDIVSMMKPITKYAQTLISGNKLPYILENAFRAAEDERPGASLIELPEDIAAEEVDIAEIPKYAEKIRRPVIDEKTLTILKKELESAKTPIILIGAGANRKRITKYLSKFIDKYNIPFFNSQMGKGVIDESKKQFLGTAAVTTGDYLHEAIEKSDLILSVGYDPIEKPTHLLGLGGIKTIQINFYETEVNEVYNPFLEVIGDIGNTFWQLFELDINSSNWHFDEIYSISKAYKQKIITNRESEDMGNGVMGPRKLIQDIRSTLQKDDIVSLDNGLYKVWFARNYQTFEPNTLLLDNALATMGAGVAAGLEAKRIHPEKNVVVVTGDGGLVMNLGDLETVVRLNLDITIVVLNNGSYGMIKWKQGGVAMPQWGLDFGNPDFVQLAESFGGTGYRVTHKDDFANILQQANAEKGMKIIDLPFDYPQEIT